MGDSSFDAGLSDKKAVSVCRKAAFNLAFSSMFFASFCGFDFRLAETVCVRFDDWQLAKKRCGRGRSSSIGERGRMRSQEARKNGSRSLKMRLVQRAKSRF